MSSNYNTLFLAHQNASAECDNRIRDMNEALHWLNLHRKEGFGNEIKREEAKVEKARQRLDEAERKEKIAKKNLDAATR